MLANIVVVLLGKRARGVRTDWDRCGRFGGGFRLAWAGGVFLLRMRLVLGLCGAAVRFPGIPAFVERYTSCVVQSVICHSRFLYV